MTMACICLNDEAVFFTTVGRKEQQLFSCVRFNLYFPDHTLGGSCGNKIVVSDSSNSAVNCSQLLFGKTWQQHDLHLFSSPRPVSSCKIYIFACTKVNWFGNGFGEAICLQLSEKPRLRQGPLNHTFSSPVSSVSQHRTWSNSSSIFI